MRNVAIAGCVLGLMLALTGCDVDEADYCDQVGSQHTNKDGTRFTCKTGLYPDGGYWYREN